MPGVGAPVPSGVGLGGGGVVGAGGCVGVVSVVGGVVEGGVGTVTVGGSPVVETSAGALGACVLGSWVDSVVTSVTGAGAGLATGVGKVATGVGAATATVTGVCAGIAIFAFLTR